VDARPPHPRLLPVGPRGDGPARRGGGRRSRRRGPRTSREDRASRRRRRLGARSRRPARGPRGVGHQRDDEPDPQHHVAAGRPARRRGRTDVRLVRVRRVVRRGAAGHVAEEATARREVGPRDDERHERVRPRGTLRPVDHGSRRLPGVRSGDHPTAVRRPGADRAGALRARRRRRLRRPVPGHRRLPRRVPGWGPVPG
jgi:hypothetical protein